jgi:hypothetical protein
MRNSRTNIEPGRSNAAQKNWPVSLESPFEGPTSKLEELKNSVISPELDYLRNQIQSNF